MLQYENGWIPVEQGLPDHGQGCFVWYNKPHEGWYYTIFMDGESVEESFGCTDVTHWRPVFKDPVNKGDES